MSERKYQNLALANMIWHLLERFGAQGVTFVVSIILARLLAPADYGVVALISVFTSILSIFIGSGLPTALVQKKDADDLDFSSMFYFNILMCLLLYTVMFFSAPAIARFYNIPELVSLTRVASLSLIVSGLKSVQSTYVYKNLMFKKFFFATLGGTIGAAFIGIGMAYRGYGCWAIVIQGLFNHLMDTIILWFSVKWRPKWMFSFKRLVESLKFGWKILAVVIVNRIYENLRTLVIGKRYTAQDLAFYHKASGFPSTVNEVITGSIDVVMFPILSLEQEDREKLRHMVSKGIKKSTFVLMPMMMGLAVCAEPIVRLLLTEKWLPMVFFMRLFCISYAFTPIESINLSAVKAMGRGDILLKIQIVKKLLSLAILLLTMFISVRAIAVGLLVSTLLGIVIDTIPNRTLLRYSFLQQLKDIAPQFFLSIGMGGIVFSFTFLPWNTVIVLGLQIATGVSVYLAGGMLFKLETMGYVSEILRKHHLLPRQSRE